VHRDPVLGTDRLLSALLDFGAGKQVSFTVSTQSVPFQRVQVVGTTGRIELFVPFNAARDAQMELALDEGGQRDGSSITMETLPLADQYRLQVEDFSRRVREGTDTDKTNGLADAVAQARVIDALWQSERSGRWEAIA
jgi:predicted dehydrogenase